MDRVRFNLSEYFQDVSTNNLYTDTNISDHTLVHAQYMCRKGYEDDPDICAIPRCPTQEEIHQLTNIMMPNYDVGTALSLNRQEKLDQALQFQNVVCPLAIHFEMAEAVNRCLISSYQHRQIMEGMSYVSGKAQARFGGIVSEPKDDATRTENLYVVGKTSYGKTLARKLVISKIYPKAIYHDFGDRSYTQIPILGATSVVGNMYCYYEQIVQRIDDILDTGDMYSSYFKAASKSNIGKATGVIKRYIKLFHIGALLIEECEFLHGSDVLEDLINLSEDTGVSIIIIGNPKDENRVRGIDLMDRPRINLRFQNIIEADDISSPANRAFLKLAAKSLWDYQWTPFVPLTDEMCGLLMEYSVYNICILKALIKKLMDTVIEHRKKTLSPELIREVGDKYFLRAKSLLDTDPDSLIEYIDKDIYKKTERSFAEVAANTPEDDLDSREAKSVISQAYNAIKMVADPETFSDIRIMQAVRSVVARDMTLISLGATAVAQKAFQVLNDNQEKARLMVNAKKEKSKKDKQAYQLNNEALENLKKSITKPNVSVG